MAWVKVDDQLHAHRKTRAAITSAPDKRRDAAAMGLWILASSWASQNRTNGWVPAMELDRWDDDWVPLAQRLVDAELWAYEERDSEPGYGVVNWEEYNNRTALASESGRRGNHTRWHVKRGIVSPDCEYCHRGDRGAIGGDGTRSDPIENDPKTEKLSTGDETKVDQWSSNENPENVTNMSEFAPENRGAIGGRSQPESGTRSGANRKTSLNPNPNPNTNNHLHPSSHLSNARAPKKWMEEK